MNLIIILLCALVNRVTSQTHDVFPATILAQQKTIRENDDLYVTCSTFGIKKNAIGYVYVCKDYSVIIKGRQKQEQHDTTFTIRVDLNYSGNYSCVYTTRNDSLSKVNTEGRNIIQIVVIANYLPADISIAGPSTVTEGEDVVFRCTVSDTLQTLGKCQLIHSYLRRNEAILQVQTFNVTRMEATFTIQGATKTDSGHYSCVVLPSKCVQEHEKALYGNNAVLLEVKDSLFLGVIVFCGMITVMLLLCLCLLWWINKTGSSALCNLRAASQQANTDMLWEQQEQTEGANQEAQAGGSFNMDPPYEDGYENCEDVEESTYSDDTEGVYSLADKNDDEYDDIDLTYANAN